MAVTLVSAQWFRFLASACFDASSAGGLNRFGERRQNEVDDTYFL